MRKFCRTASLSIRIATCWAMMLLSFCFSDECHSKLRSGVCGRVYLTSGDTIVACDSMRIVVPKKNKKVEIIDKAYTKKNEISKRVAPEETDSLVLWTSTAPGYPHTFRFIPDQGWSFQAEHTPHIAVYCCAPKGYRLSGNGGLWMIGKSRMFVVKDGKIYIFGRPDSKADKKFRRQLAELVADDADLADYIKSATGRRDKILRSLRMYNPKK